MSKVISMTDVATLLLAPFGGFALNLSAITAAIVMGKEARVDPDKRYTAAVSCGAIYLVIGVFGAAAAVKEEVHREAALNTVLVTLSGVVIAGISSALWGVVAGALALFVQQYRQVKTFNS